MNEGNIMLKKIIATTAASILLAATVCMSASALDVVIDGEKVVFDDNYGYPFITEGRTLVPLRAIAEALGCEVEYDDTTKTVTIKNEKITVELVLNADTAKVNGEEVKLSKEAKVVSDRTMVPARFVSESMGYDVDWDQDSLSVLVD